MILLDTNVLSECLRPQPDRAVLNWLSRQPRASLFTATMVEAELLYGVQLLPESDRKVQLLRAIQAIFNEDFAGRVLSFDREAAQAYAIIASARKTAGKPISQM
ncbi:MAG: VapC toxin family PIN domain ribonuclease, partial [Acinetobacter sp.]|nr:VapC toxin family PIN domain ribonuclease [Acinetobacter sp.]